MERVLRRMGVDRQQLSITNALRCRPRNNFLENAPWEFSALNSCRPNLDAAIAERSPRCIVALGGIALRELTGEAGSQRGISHLAGYVLPGPNGVPVVGNFHPAYLRRGKASHQGVFARILQRALNIAAGRDTNWIWNIDPEVPDGRLAYRCRPSLEEARSYIQRVRDRSGSVVSYDIETSESASLDEDAREGFVDTHIRYVQFSVEPGEGIALPWEGEYREVARDILHTPNVKCGHNVWLFDNKVLRAAGEREGFDLRPRGTVHDTLAMFHHWQPDLPAHLQFAASFVQFPFPWKHLAATNIEFYGCCDVDATLRLYTMLEKTLKRDDLWGDDTRGYLGQVYSVRPILAAMEDRGMLIDNDERLKLGVEFERAQEELGRELDQLFPESERSIHPKVGYKRPPKELDGLVLRTFDDASVDGNGNPIVAKVERYCRLEPFNPNSRDQVIRYMKSKGHPVPKDKHRENDEGQNPDTTNEKELRRLANKTGDTFYLKVVEYRGFTKLRGTYIDGFVPGADGCVHTTFTFDTAIAQLSSRNPNIQNFTKLKPTPGLARAMRGMVAAKPGKIITEWDYKSCHVLTLGFLAEDAQWMRLARLDMHSFIAGHLLDCWDCLAIINESDEQLMARFKWLKSDPDRKRVRDDQAKHGILGIGNGLQAKGLYDRYMESFPPRKCPTCLGSGKIVNAATLRVNKCSECHGTCMQPGTRVAERVLEIARLIGPRVFQWQRRKQEQAHKDQMLRTEFGHMRRFYEVFRWDPRRNDWGHGDQAEEAIAYHLSNVAHAHMRETMKELARRGLDEKYGLFNQIHDALLFQFDERLLDEHVREVYPIMTAPSKVLRNPAAPDGLVIECEASAGYRWNAMREINLHAARTEVQSAKETADELVRGTSSNGSTVPATSRHQEPQLAEG